MRVDRGEGVSVDRAADAALFSAQSNSSLRHAHEQSLAALQNWAGLND